LELLEMASWIIRFKLLGVTQAQLIQPTFAFLLICFRRSLHSLHCQLLDKHWPGKIHWDLLQLWCKDWQSSPSYSSSGALNELGLFFHHLHFCKLTFMLIKAGH